MGRVKLKVGHESVRELERVRPILEMVGDGLESEVWEEATGAAALRPP